MTASNVDAPSRRLACALTCLRVAEHLASLRAVQDDAALAAHWREQARIERAGVEKAAREA